MISIRNLRKSYKLGGETIMALDDINLDIQRGEFLSIVGTSGSGKSTLMNMIGGLDHPDDGKILIDGKDLSKMQADDLAILRNNLLGFVFQSFQLMPRQNALKNVVIPLLYRRPRVKNAYALAKASLGAVGLGDRIDHKPSQLSSGQQQRVAIARALVGSPLLILADEPTGALDSHTTAEIMKLFGKLSDNGKTILIVTHDKDVASYTKRIVTMNDGTISRDQKFH